MELPRTSLLTTAAAAAAAIVLRKHDADARQAAERMAAAALEALLNAIDANDADTGAHVRRVATYSLIIADEAGLSIPEQASVERIALFHDIGKIHEALFDIIHDDKVLSPDDRRAIATHPARGAEVLAPLDGFYPELAQGVLSHHEHWNGTGYPQRLKGRRIPIAARIVSIADSFDAITHHRRYRAGRPVEAARDIILAGRATQFDPELVDLFTFPPVFARIAAAERQVAKWQTPIHQRREGRDEQNVPEISFRWRPGRRGSRGRPASDQPRKKER
ncbi:MAG: metal-dependent phosphohydrolase region [Gemmatimonadetes bacterium]|nr:metal-dependent phosphohydrolase region [Gemmatimonadota bacterium]